MSLLVKCQCTKQFTQWSLRFYFIQGALGWLKTKQVAGDTWENGNVNCHLWVCLATFCHHNNGWWSKSWQQHLVLHYKCHSHLVSKVGFQLTVQFLPFWVKLQWFSFFFCLAIRWITHERIKVQSKCRVNSPSNVLILLSINSVLFIQCQFTV